MQFSHAVCQITSPLVLLLPNSFSNIIHLVHLVPEPFLSIAKSVKLHMCAYAHVHTPAGISFLVAFRCSQNPE